MIKLLILIIAPISILISGLQPPTFCTEQTPFRLADQTCEQFDEICLKKDDRQCKQLLDSCKQCPPNNITLISLRDILRYSKFVSDVSRQLMENKIPKIIVQLNTTQQFMKNKMNNVPEILLIFITIMLVILIIYKIFKITAKFTRCQKCKSDYKLLKDRKLIYFEISKLKEQIKEEIKEQIENQNKEILNKLEEVKEQIKESIKEQIENQNKEISILVNELGGAIKNIPFASIKFLHEGYEPIQLIVKENQNIVFVKRQICDQLPKIKVNYYKMMKLKYNGKDLDDNDYLLKLINFTDPTVNYYFDSKTNEKIIAVVKLQGEMQLPEMLQLTINNTLEDVMKKIKEITNLDNLVIFKVGIDNQRFIETKSKDFLVDGEWLTVIEKKSGKVSIRSIRDEQQITEINYLNTDSVSFLFDSIKENAVLFYKNIKLDKNKFIFEYKIDNDSTIECYIFQKFKNSDFKNLDTNDICGLYNAKTKKNEDILLKKYSMGESYKNNDWENENFIINELKAFQIRKLHSRFIQLLDIYVSDKDFYISMEFMSQGTLISYLKKHKDLRDLKILLKKWSTQILEGLKFLHDRNVIYRNLNPSDILLNENLNLKLSGFFLTKYDNNFGPSSILGKKYQSCPIKVRYMAPEILESKPHGMKCDIWSFGAVLIRITTGKKPLSDVDKEEAKSKIVEDGTLKYDSSLINDSLYNFIPIIDLCIKRNPNERATIDNLQLILKKV